MILAWLLLLTGLTISAVAIYYSVVGLTAIFSAAVIPIIIMGSALEVGKLVCASWLKANWERAPRFIKYYMIIAVIVLMLITSMGIFGFLSKAHNDQNLVSGDVQSKIAIYDEKIKTAKENIEANRKQLKQMDEAVDQVMGRSQDEKGADKANNIRRSQQRDRSALAKDIEANQKQIASLNDEAAPIRAEVRKVEAEVGPIKYIAKFIYGDHGADENMLEKAVTWIIVLIVVVFDPLAVIMLLAAQMTFGWRKEQQDTIEEKDTPPEALVAIFQEGQNRTAEDDSLTTESDNNIVIEPTVIEPTHTEPVPSETPLTALGGDITAPEEPEVPNTTESELDKWNKMIEEAEHELAQEAIKQEEAKRYHPETAPTNNYTEVTGDRLKPDLTEVIEPESDESKKKTYMIKDLTGQIQVKARE
jgi:Tfp pilus assembly protein PilO